MRKNFKTGEMMKRILALALALVLVLGYIPADVQAADGGYYVIGKFNGEEVTIPLVYDGEGDYKATVSLTAGYHEFKVVNADGEPVKSGSAEDGSFRLPVLADCDVSLGYIPERDRVWVTPSKYMYVFLHNTQGWVHCNAHRMSDFGEASTAWPGADMSRQYENYLRVYVPAASFDKIVFNNYVNGSGVRQDTKIPYDGSIVYDNTTKTWGPCPHPDHNAQGKCVVCSAVIGHSYDSTGLCGCGAQAEALVDGTEFMSYLDAVQNVTGGGTIKLLTDVTADSVNCENAHYLDLNGKTLTVSELWAPSTSSLRIQDNTAAQEGRIVGDVYTSRYLYLEGGTIEGTVWLTSYSQLKGSFTMTGGAIKADTDIRINTDGTAVKIQGGEFIDGLKIGNGTSVSIPMTLADTLSPGYGFYQNGSVVDMTGVTTEIPGATVKVQEHTHSYSSTTGFCPCGEECAHASKTNGVCDTCGMADAHTHEFVNGSCSCGKTAQVLVTYSDNTGKYFETLQGALDTFSKNNSYAHVKLLTNIAVGGNISADIYTHYTLDLNGYALTASELVVPASGGMEIMDGSAGQTGQINAIVRAHGPLTIWSGTFNDTVLVTTMSNVFGSVSVRDGKFTAATDFQIADDGCTLSLWSGTFPGGIKVEAISGATKDELADFLYNSANGNSYFQDCEKVTLTAGQSEISGGHVVVAYDAKHQFGSNTKCSYCGLDAIVSMTLDGVTTYYGTVYDLRQDLVQENAGCTLQLLTDITTDYFSDKDGRCGFYLDLNGHTLTATDAVSLPGSSGCTIMDTSDEGDGRIVGNVYAAYSTALTGGTIEGTVSFPKKATYTGYTFQMEGGSIDADMDFAVNDNNTTIELTGGTFPGGISIACGDNVTTPMTLADCISGSYRYFQNGSVVTLAEGQTEITGGDVRVLSHAAHSFDANGYCAGCGAQAIASVNRDGTTNYYTSEYYLERDLNAGLADCTLKLLQDISTDDLDINCGCTLDLNGHTLTVTGYVLMPIGEESTIMDSSDEGDGKIVGRVLAGTTTTLDSGTIEGSVDFASNTGSYTFYMQGGSIDAATDFMLYNESVTIELTGGTFPGGIKVSGYLESMILADCISGSYRYFLDGSVVTLTEGQTEITGGDVTVAEHTEHTHTYNADGFCEAILSDTNAVCGGYEKPQGAGTEETPYLIDNAGKLYWFAAVVNGGYEDTDGNSAACATLTESVEIPEGMSWTPISGYRGTFDGNECGISGMHVSSDAYYVGMFSKTGTCTIQDLTIAGSSFETTNIRGFAGAIAGYCGDGTSDKATITGCHVNDVTVTGWTAGGIAGCLYNYSEVKDCTTAAELVVNAEQEGGAVAGRCQNGSYIEWVSAQGTVTGYYAGGIVGYVVNDAGPYANRTNEVVLSTYVGDVGTSETLYAGGIIGYVSASSKAAINNCSVKCNVTAEYSVNSRACGLLGYSGNGSYSMVTVSNSFTIDTTLNPNMINKASLVSGGATVTNCYSDDQENPLTISASETDCAKKTDEQFKSGEVAYLLDAPQSTHAWGQNIDNGNMNYGFPVRGQYKVYRINVDCSGTVGYSNTDADKASHVPTHVPAVAATCQSQGKIEHWACVCGKFFAEEACTTELGEADVVAPKLDHSYANGFCTNVVNGAVCDAYQPAELVTAENCAGLGLDESYIGYYAIGNGGQLYWFADKVNNENDTYGSGNVVLTKDITVNSGTVTAESIGMRQWEPIGNGAYYDGEHIAFGGIFDGNGKTVSGLYIKRENRDDHLGLICETKETAIIKNVTLSNSCFISQYERAAGIVYVNNGIVTGCVNQATIVAGDAAGIACLNYGVIELCGNTGEISCVRTFAGGIVGDNGAGGTVRNCWNTGNIVGGSYAGGIVGMQVHYPNTADILLENCWSTGAVSSKENSVCVGGVTGQVFATSTVRNCYTTMPVAMGSTSTDVLVENVESKTLAQFESGEVAYLLRVNSAEGTDVWGQDLDNGKTPQTVPTFDGADVYYGYSSCADTEAEYTNDSSISPDPIPHDWEYTANGAEITAACKYGCGTDGGKVTLKFNGNPVYDGTMKLVDVEGSLAGIDTLSPIVYRGDRILVGIFTANLEVEDAVARLSVEILPYELEVKTFVPGEKIYDGTTDCGIQSLTFASTSNGEELVLGTDFTAELTFPAADAGEYDDAVLTVTLLDTAKASNYVLKTNTVTGVIHAIDPAPITVTDVKVADKVYDGTTDATVTSVTISGNLPGDDVKVETTGSFADKNSGEEKTVNLTYTLSGDDAGNYVLAEATGTATGKVTVKPLPEIMEPAEGLSVDNVTSDDKETLEDVKEELAFVLTDEGLSDEEHQEREDALQDVQDMLDRIQDAADAITTDPIMDTKDITAENVVLEDKEDIIAALDDLYGALEDYENNYTDSEKEGIHDDIERLEAALAALKEVEDLIQDVEDLPDEVEPDTPRRDDILDAKDRYDGLDDHQKELVPEEIVQKLEDLLADLNIYRIIKGDGQVWSEGELSFTANGPFETFVELRIDGNAVAASNYTAVSGSTVVTIKESYAETLTAGKHSISFVYPDGEATGSFTVVIPTNGSATTGDEANVLFWTGAMAVSLAALAVLLADSRKRRYAR